MKKMGFYCCNFGYVTATVAMSGTEFSPGDPVPIHMDINNQAARTIRLVVTLKRYDTFYVHHSYAEKSKSLVKVVSRQIQVGEDTFETRDLIIGTNVLTTIRSCACIKVEYYLVFKLWRFSCKQCRIPIAIIA